MTIDATNPTPNVQKVQYAGLPVHVENPVGSTRTGTNSKGEPWSVNMLNAYGYIPKANGADGEALDTYLGSDETL